MSLTKVSYSMINGAAVNVLDFGAKGDGSTDDTAAIQAAVDYAVVSNIVVNGRSCTVYFPHGTYKVTNTITISGAVALVGDTAPMSISGARIIQYTPNKSLFSVTGATNAAIFVSGLLLKDSSGVSDSTIGLFYVDSSVTSGNSFYFRDTWFSTPSHYAINILCSSDDLQITGCTFDVTFWKFINLGSVTKQLSNFAISDNTFYAGANGSGFIDVINVSAGVISNNRFYTGGAVSVPYAIKFPNALSSKVTIEGNTCTGIDAMVDTQSGQIVIADNIVKGAKSPVAIGGGGTVGSIIINGNLFSGASGAFGLIDVTGTGLTASVIQNNAFIGNDGGTSAYALNLAGNFIPGNVIQGNQVNNVTNANQASAAYLTGGWSPDQGGGLTVVGTFSSSAAYVKMGRLVTVSGYVAATTSITITGPNGVICTNLPFTSSQLDLGNLMNNAKSAAYTAYSDTGTSMYAMEAIAATPKIYFTLTYLTDS